MAQWTIKIIITTNNEIFQTFAVPYSTFQYVMLDLILTQLHDICYVYHIQSMFMITCSNEGGRLWFWGFLTKGYSQYTLLCNTVAVSEICSIVHFLCRSCILWIIILVYINHLYWLKVAHLLFYLVFEIRDSASGLKRYIKMCETVQLESKID